MSGSLPVRGSSGAARDHARMWFDAWRVPALRRPLAVGRSVRLVGRVPESRVGTLFVDNGWLTAVDFHAHESPRSYAMGKSK